MINLNGTLYDSQQQLLLSNRGYQYGDALFETLKVVYGKILFWEDHYFRLMASMRILRMEIPMNFTMEFLESEILKTVTANNLIKSTARVRFNVHRVEGGKYTPQSNDIQYNIAVEELPDDFYNVDAVHNYTIDLFKDYFVTPGLLSTLKTNNKIINVLGSIYAKENNLHNCLLLNTDKNVIEALNGNVFLVKDKVIKTPPLSDGCLKGIMRKQLIDIIKTMDDYRFEEASISSFELQKADELFISNIIAGIQPVASYRKKTFAAEVSKQLMLKLNTKLRLS